MTECEICRNSIEAPFDVLFMPYKHYVCWECKLTYEPLIVGGKR